MKRIIFLYGLFLALLLLFFQFWDYHFFAHNLSLQTYLALIAVFCTALGIWAGLRLTRPQPLSAVEPTRPIETAVHFDLSQREQEVLQLMAEGLSNQEIADRLFISLSTVKTHCANLYGKLDVKRRTQAVATAQKHQLLA